MKEINFERTIGLISQRNFEIIQNKTILIAGLGGVGGTAFEALLRSGFLSFILVDKDKVDASNLNRQILYKEEDIGENKVDIAKKYALSINKKVNIVTYNADVNELNLNDIHFDFIIDAIDDVTAKIKLAKIANIKEVPYIMSLGMANRLDPAKVVLKRLDKTTDDPLAKKVRYLIKKENIITSNIMSVVSLEKPIKDGSALHSMMMVPSAAGLAIAHFVISYFIK